VKFISDYPEFEKFVIYTPDDTEVYRSEKKEDQFDLEIGDYKVVINGHTHPDSTFRLRNKHTVTIKHSEYCTVHVSY